MDAKKPIAYDEFKRKTSWNEVEEKKLMSVLSVCVDEDTNKNEDITTKFCKIEGIGTAEIISREDIIICGLPILKYITRAFNTNVEIENIQKDGDKVSAQNVIAKLHGIQSEILLIERTILNFLQKLSGIATSTKKYVEILEKHGVYLLDTRKTTPNLRIIEKYASSCGGGYNHRMGLFDRILIKDNHLAALKIDSINDFSKFLRKIREENKQNIIEIEIDTIEYLEPAIESGVDAVLLDNFKPNEIKDSVMINKNRVVLEASGGIALESLEEFANAKPHFISTGAPIHSSRWVDIGLDWK